MLLHLVDKRTGDQHAADIGVDDTPITLKELALQEFSGMFGVEVADLQLSVGGQVLCDDEPLSSTADVEEGCTVDVDLDCQRHLDDLHSRRKDVMQVPLWVSKRAELMEAANLCAPAMLEHAHITVKADRQFCLAFVQHPYRKLCFEYVHDSLKADS